MLKLYRKIDAIQKEIGSLIKDGKNPHFGNTYVTKDSLLLQLRPYFDKHKILCIQPPQGDRVETKIICLESGEELTCSINFPSGIVDPQRILSCVTYFDRGTLTSLLGLPTTDDDGNHASGKKPTLVNGTKQYANVVNFITKDPEATLEKIKKEYTLTDTMQKQLIKLINLNH